MGSIRYLAMASPGCLPGRTGNSPYLAALQVAQDTIDRVLGHAAGTLAGTYNRHQYPQEKRQALEAWARRVELIVNGSGGKVVVFRPSA